MNAMKIKIDIETKTFVRLLLIITGFIGAGLLIMKLEAALTLILVAFLLAIALSTPVGAIARRLPGQSRVGATLIAYLVVLAIVGVFLYVALPPTIDQTSRFISAIPDYIRDLSEKRGPISDFVKTYNLQDELNNIVEAGQNQAVGIAGGIGSSIVGGITSIFGGFVTLITTLVLSFLMLVEGPKWQQRLWSLYDDPEKLARHQNLMAKMRRVVSSYVSGQVLVAGIATLASVVVLIILSTVFQVPTNAVVPLAGVIFLSDLVPVIGATIGAIIVTLVLLLSDWVAALSFLVYFFVYQQVENNFIQPLVQARTVALSALSVLAAVIIGIGLFGIAGGIVAIPIAGCLRVLVLDYLEHRKARKEPKRSGIFKFIKSVEKA